MHGPQVLDHNQIPNHPLDKISASAGLGALLRSANPELTALQIREILESTTDKIEDNDPDPVLEKREGTYQENGHSLWFGFGKINAEKAMERVLAALPSEPINDPQPGSPPLADGALRIISALANPIGKESGAEKVGIFNFSPSPIDLSDWHIVDNKGRKDRLPATEIKSGQYLEIPLKTAKLSNQGGSIELLDAAEQIVDSVTYNRDMASREGWLIRF